MTATQKPLTRKPARALERSSAEMARGGGKPLGTNETGTRSTERRSLLSSVRETATTPRVKLPRKRANPS